MIKKAALFSILLGGMVGALTLQANEVPDTLNKDSRAQRSSSMPMDMQGMQGMMGMMKMMMGNSEQMGEMMTACTKMMEAHANDHPKPSAEDEPKG